MSRPVLHDVLGVVVLRTRAMKVVRVLLVGHVLRIRTLRHQQVVAIHRLARDSERVLAVLAVAHLNDATLDLVGDGLTKRILRSTQSSGFGVDDRINRVSVIHNRRGDVSCDVCIARTSDSSRRYLNSRSRHTLRSKTLCDHLFANTLHSLSRNLDLASTNEI